jgi:hypothetical protein
MKEKGNDKKGGGRKRSRVKNRKRERVMARGEIKVATLVSWCGE